MGQETKHTPGPWAIEEDNLGCKNIVAISEGEDGGIFTANPQIGYTHGLADEDEDRANAEFIVRACNSHAELLEALRRIAINAGIGVGAADFQFIKECAEAAVAKVETQ